MTTESQRGGVGEWVLVPREPTDDMLVFGQEAWAKARAKIPKSAIEDCDEANAVYKAMIAASPVKVESGEAVSEQDLRDAVTFLREMRTVDSFHIARYPPHGRDDMPLAVDLADRIEAALSSRRSDDRVNSGTNNGKVGGGVG